MSFNMTERDLDLFILEELHASSGFDCWFAAQIGLSGCRCILADHSQSAKVGEKWGETDVLAIFSNGREKIAVLIEDKIAAAFADRQAERYHERAALLVEAEHADRYCTVLVAPQIYFDDVPIEDRWDKRVALEAVRDWFAGIESAHARWRADALSRCVKAVKRTRLYGREHAKRMSREFDAALRREPSGHFKHNPTAETWFIIDTGLTPSYVQLSWKTSKRRVELGFAGPHLGKADGCDPPDGIIRHLRGQSTAQRTDTYCVEVPFVDLSQPLADQPATFDAVMAAIWRLVPLVEIVVAQPAKTAPPVPI